jgi:hypothetical protein
VTESDAETNEVTSEALEVEDPLANGNDEPVTVWAPEPSGADEILAASVDEWIATVDFESTADVPIPDRLVDQVIGQEACFPRTPSKTFWSTPTRTMKTCLGFEPSLPVELSAS